MVIAKTAPGPRDASRREPGRNTLQLVTPYRARLYRLIFAAAAVYNVGFGLWAGVRPGAFFELFTLAPPRYPSIWACLGMVIGLYAAAYAYASRAAVHRHRSRGRAGVTYFREEVP